MKNVSMDEMTKNLNPIPLEDLKKENLIEVYKIEAAFSNILRTSAVEMAELTKMVDENNKITNLGKKASEILQNSLNKFEESVSDLVDTKNYLKKKTRIRCNRGYQFKFYIFKAIINSKRIVNFSFQSCNC